MRTCKVKTSQSEKERETEKDVIGVLFPTQLFYAFMTETVAQISKALRLVFQT